MNEFILLLNITKELSKIFFLLTAITNAKNEHHNYCAMLYYDGAPSMIATGNIY